MKKFRGRAQQRVSGGIEARGIEASRVHPSFFFVRFVPSW
jgi:hypothetical protein